MKKLSMLRVKIDMFSQCRNNKIYKVTSVTERKTKNEDTVYSLLLNNYTKINNVNPSPTWTKNKESKTVPNRGMMKKLNEFWTKNNYSLNLLKGKYIFASISESNFGLQFSNVDSTDIIYDFQKILNESNGKSFTTELPIYDFLLQAKYQKNDDSSINIKSRFNNMRIRSINAYTLCYPHFDSNDVLTLENIHFIYDKFYAHIDSSSANEPEHSDYWCYKLSNNNTEIIKDTHIIRITYKATTSGDKNYHSITKVLELGDKLSSEQKLFLHSRNI